MGCNYSFMHIFNGKSNGTFLFYVDINGPISVSEKYKTSVKCYMPSCCRVNLVCDSSFMILIMLDKHTEVLMFYVKFT